MPGLGPESWGYHSDDGLLYHNGTIGARRQEWNLRYTTDDVIGCGISFQRRLIFYTRNGEIMDAVFKNLTFNRPDEPKEDDIYPMISLRSLGEKVNVNFGKEPFVFDIVAYCNRRTGWGSQAWVPCHAAFLLLHN
jgi:Ran-binding protein 9/10